MTDTETRTAIPGYTAGTWTIDPVHSEVGFTVRHMMVSKVRGRFTSFSGEIVTGADPLDSSVTAEIALDSIVTGQEQRDAHIRSADFFDVENHPTMTYRSTGVRAHGDGYVVDGELTLKGVTKDVPLRRHPGRLHRHRGDQPERLRRQLQRRHRGRRRRRQRQGDHPARDRGRTQGLIHHRLRGRAERVSPGRRHARPLGARTGRGGAGLAGTGRGRR